MTLPQANAGLVSIPMANVSHMTPHGEKTEQSLREAALHLESVFLGQMLKSAGLEGLSGEFSGGIGEEQTASFLRDAQARQMAETGGFGLAESIFQTLLARSDAA